MTTYDKVALVQELKRDEGVRLTPYLDSVGKTTIGVGRNLTDVGISSPESLMLLANDILRSEADLDRTMPWWRELSDGRQRALLNMCFNLGVNSLLGFTATLAHLRSGDYAGAANSAMQSKWAKQVGARATRVTDLIRTG